MTKEAIEHIIRRCSSLLKRKNGTTKVKEEYFYWVDWLKKELKKYKNDEKLLKLIDKEPHLKKDLKIK